MFSKAKGVLSAAVKKWRQSARPQMRRKYGAPAEAATVSAVPAETDLARLTALFEAQVGTMESGENNVIYNTDYYGRPVSGPDYPWCCAFIWDVFRMAGLSALFCGGQKTAWCPFVADYARNHGQWVTSGYRQGDLILYEFGGDSLADHIGFCTQAAGSVLTVVEGNVDGAVRRMNRNAASVMGAYRPQYDGASGERVYIVRPGDSLWGIAQAQLGDGARWKEIYTLNHLTSAVIHPGQRLLLPVESPPEAPPAEPTTSVKLRVLRRGMQGRDAAALQWLLIRAGYPLPQFGTDGDFGQETETALPAFQRAAALEVTGTADAKTWEELIG